MNWIERINTPLIIITGDGVNFRPIWKNPTKATEYNIAEFDFPEVDGTMVRRGRPRGRKFPLEFYFQGEDHIDKSTEFETSARDPRPWSISHPYYGDLVVHPTALEIDNTGDNVSKMKCTVIETITEDNPKITVDPKDQIENDHAEYIGRITRSYENVQFDVSGLKVLDASATDVYNLGYPKIKLTIDATEFSNRFQEAQAAFLNATAKPMAAMEAMNQLITYVAEFKIEAELVILGDFSVSSVQNRLNALKDQYDAIRDGISTITDRVHKLIFESVLGSIISTMCLSSSTPEDEDYGSAEDALTVMVQILDTYNDYIAALDELQTDNGGDTESFIPQYDSLQQLSTLVNYTVSNLYNIALNAKQERSILCEKNTDVITLAHRFYGLDLLDANINKIIRTNKIGLNEYLQIRKGRKILYYV